MNLIRRKFLELAAGAGALPAAARLARAQAYPSRPVHLISTYAPGGINDLFARLIGQWLSQHLGQQFIVDNRSGAGGTIGTEAVVRSAPDGYTLLLVDTSNTFNVTLYEHLNFNFIRDIAPVAGIFRGASLLVRHPSFPAASVPELISYAKANPGKVTMASAGIGSIPHVAGELFKILAGVDIVQVQYRGSGPALVDMLGGQTQVTFATVPSSIEYVRAGRLLPLAVTSARRLDILPDVPTVSEFVRGYEITAWTGLGAPKGTPAGIIDRLNKETNAALADAKMKARFAELGGVAIPGPPADFARFIAGEAERWGKVIRTANIKPE
ncbi:MAG TPA: tripartite tricarboxylate transporter substrate binding protein [Xanthobacteraceae bacterium]|jgi:tripartite-type tricarboxylate transporter receptor subunit TctC